MRERNALTCETVVIPTQRENRLSSLFFKALNKKTYKLLSVCVCVGACTCVSLYSWHVTCTNKNFLRLKQCGDDPIHSTCGLVGSSDS